MAEDPKDQQSYYKLDPGEPRLHPDDYTKAGLGSFEEANAAVSPDVGPQTDPERDNGIAAQVTAKLEEHQFVDAGRLTVDVHNGTVTLQGPATNRYARSRAEDLAREVEGVTEVVNKIAVQPEEESAGGPILTTHMPGADNEGSTQRS